MQRQGQYVVRDPVVGERFRIMMIEGVETPTDLMNRLRDGPNPVVFQVISDTTELMRLEVDLRRQAESPVGAHSYKGSVPDSLGSLSVLVDVHFGPFKIVEGNITVEYRYTG